MFKVSRRLAARALTTPSDLGLLVKPVPTGGVLISTSLKYRLASALLSIMPLAVFGLSAWLISSQINRSEWTLPPDPGIFVIVPDWILTDPLVVFAPFLFVLVIQIVWLFLVREEWYATDNWLQIRIGLFGLAWTRIYRNAELLIEAHGQSGFGPSWRLAIREGLAKRYLVTESRISVFGGGHISTRELIEGMARLLALHTHWQVKELADELNATHPPPDKLSKMDSDAVA